MLELKEGSVPDRQTREKMEGRRRKKNSDEDSVQEAGGGIWSWKFHGAERFVDHCQERMLEDRATLLEEKTSQSLP